MKIHLWLINCANGLCSTLLSIRRVVTLYVIRRWLSSVLVLALIVFNGIGCGSDVELELIKEPNEKSIVAIKPIANINSSNASRLIIKGECSVGTSVDSYKGFASEEDTSTDSNGDFASEEDVSTDSNEDFVSEEDVSTDSNEEFASEEDASTDSNGDFASEEDISTDSNGDFASEEDISTDSNGDFVSEEDISTDSNGDFVSEEDISTDSNGDFVSEEDVSTDSNGDFASEEDVSTDSSGGFASEEEYPTDSNEDFVEEDSSSLVDSESSSEGLSIKVDIGPVNRENFISVSVPCSNGSWETDALDITRFHGEPVISITATPIFDSGEQGVPVSFETTNNFQCPKNYVPVPVLEGYITNSFCVAKYEMKQVPPSEEDEETSMEWLSQAQGLPFATTKPEAQINCQGLGSDSYGTYDLIRNNEWQSLARNMELVGTNWGSGFVGATDGLNRGHSTVLEDVDVNGLEASEDDDKSCYGLKIYDNSQYIPITSLKLNIGVDSSLDPNSPLGGGKCLNPWHSRRRTHNLSNGEVVWDLAGNLCEWIKEDLSDEHQATVTSNIYLSMLTDFNTTDGNNYPLVSFKYVVSNGSIVAEESFMETKRSLGELFGPSGNYSHLNFNPSHENLSVSEQAGDDTDPDSGSYHGNIGFGQFEFVSNGSAYEICRGGDSGRSDQGVVAGIFSVRMITDREEKNAFRCVYHPLERNLDLDRIEDPNPADIGTKDPSEPTPPPEPTGGGDPSEPTPPLEPTDGGDSSEPTPPLDPPIVDVEDPSEDITLSAPSLSVEVAIAQVVLSWVLLPEEESLIAKHQYQYKLEEEDFSSWIDIPNSAANEVNARSYTVENLTSNEKYIFKLRAVDSSGLEGDASESIEAIPLRVSSLGRRISAGGQHTCLSKEDKTVQCWGYGSSGQLGDNIQSSHDSPVTVVNTQTTGTLINSIQVSVGSYHSCSLNLAGGVRCWGYGGEGQLGQGANQSSKAPLLVTNLAGDSSLTNISQISAGANHTCVLNNNGKVFCWGNGISGQLGNGSNENHSRPQRVKDEDGESYLSGIVQVASGSEHTCALESGGDVFCWGLQSYGRLGNEQSTNLSNTPVKASNLSLITKISVGGQHSCALKENSQVVCWGMGANGRLGNNDINEGDSSVPVVVMFAESAPNTGGTVSLSATPSMVALDRVEQISAGKAHTCALRGGGEVFCWGRGVDGQLGNNNESNSDSLFATRVVGLSGSGSLSEVLQINVGISHTCALKESDGVFCWGNGSNGRLGYGDNTYSKVPRVVLPESPLRRVIDSATLMSQISAGGNHSCAVSFQGKAFCWGRGDNGRLGHNATSSSSVPIRVAGINNASGSLSNISQISAGGTHSCALTRGGAALCWGQGDQGQLGQSPDNSEDSRFPVEVASTTVESEPNAKLTDVMQISTGDEHNCAVKNNGEVVCWGYGNKGALGYGDLENKYHPTAVVDVGEAIGGSPLTGVVQVSAGVEHTCAVKGAGTVVCWGSGGSGRLGHRATSRERVPVEVQSVSDENLPLVGVVQVHAGNAHTCALGHNGKAYCWGDGGFGRLTQSTEDQHHPVIVKKSDSQDLTNLQQLVAGWKHSCALRTNNEVYCWGDNSNGRLGNKSENLQELYPTSVKKGEWALKGVTQISSYGSHSCALHNDGKISCWGSGANGRLGNDSLLDQDSAEFVLADEGVEIPFSLRGYSRNISSGGKHNCVITNEKKLLCWGQGGDGRLGQGLLENGDINEETLSTSSQVVNVLDDNGDLLPGYLGGITQVSSGENHTCALKNSRKLLCWGKGEYGRLGNGSQNNRSIPSYVKDLDGEGDLTGVSQVSAGDEHTCAIRASEILCWGYGIRGRLGNDGISTKKIPDLVTNEGVAITGFMQVGAGSEHSCALHRNGEVYCWGRNVYGQMGREFTELFFLNPKRVKKESGYLIGVVEIGVGEDHSCALRNDGKVLCWGRGDHGRTGNGSEENAFSS